MNGSHEEAFSHLLSAATTCRPAGWSRLEDKRPPSLAQVVRLFLASFCVWQLNQNCMQVRCSSPKLQLLDYMSSLGSPQGQIFPDAAEPSLAADLITPGSPAEACCWAGSV